ncbi:hypothetical protein BLNAU_17383 [Blattamonas nauphoetae]|uniref:Uncharacterized protein n=1 Tax=Blattamonas nauphoetae TaxID=2049346 RepID=A0ABQ9X7M8_9EUKA|nr:hypothetical protein BLNAU_17383 [Blattamonas nauphoetae]
MAARLFEAATYISGGCPDALLEDTVLNTKQGKRIRTSLELELHALASIVSFPELVSAGFSITMHDIKNSYRLKARCPRGVEKSGTDSIQKRLPSVSDRILLWKWIHDYTTQTIHELSYWNGHGSNEYHPTIKISLTTFRKTCKSLTRAKRRTDVCNRCARLEQVNREIASLNQKSETIPHSLLSEQTTVQMHIQHAAIQRKTFNTQTSELEMGTAIVIYEYKENW